MKGIVGGCNKDEEIQEGGDYKKKEGNKNRTVKTIPSIYMYLTLALIIYRDSQVQNVHTVTCTCML